MKYVHILNEMKGRQKDANWFAPCSPRHHLWGKPSLQASPEGVRLWRSPLGVTYGDGFFTPNKTKAQAEPFKEHEQGTSLQQA